MRQSQKNNRARSKNGRKSNGPSINRVYESTGPEGKVRGTPQQIIEKYQSLARDKATAGDRVLAESFLQHAEHYLRILGAAQAAQTQPRRDERDEEDMAEAHEAEQPSSRDPQGERQPSSEGGGRSRAVSDGLAVMDADGASEMVATPESFTPPPRRGRRAAEEPEGESEASEEAPRRPRRRPTRRPKEPARTEASEQPTASTEPASVVEPSEPSKEVRVDGGDGDQDGDWSQTSAIGHA